MGRRGKKTGHGAKGKGHGGALKEKRVADHPGSTATAKGKGGMTSPVPVTLMFCVLVVLCAYVKH